MSDWKKIVHPELVKRVERLIANLLILGHDVRVVQSLRTADEQNALYAKGRSKPGKKVTNAKAWQSNHNYGLAVDLCPFINGSFDWNALDVFRLIGREAKKLGLEWGGDWKAVDMPHVQLKGLSIKECYALYVKGGLPKVWSRMYEILGGATVIGFVPAEDDILEFRDRGAAVITLQQQLVKLNFLQSHEADGEFGNITKKAVRVFQLQNNLTADGIVGDGTKAKLKSAIEKLESKKDSAAENPSDVKSVSSPRTENQPPKFEQPIAEQPDAQASATVQLQSGEATPKPDEVLPGTTPDDVPEQVSQARLSSRVYTILGSIGAVFAAVKGFISDNSMLIAIGIVCVTLLFLAMIFRGVILDWLRMQLFSDPKRYNVK